MSRQTTLTGLPSPAKEHLPYACDLCPEQFKTAQGLGGHRLHAHSGAPSRFGLAPEPGRLIQEMVLQGSEEVDPPLDEPELKDYVAEEAEEETDISFALRATYFIDY